MNRRSRHYNGTHGTKVPTRFNKQISYTNKHYPKEHYPATGSLPPLVNAGLSLHCSTSFPRIYFHSNHSSIRSRIVSLHVTNENVTVSDGFKKARNALLALIHIFL